MKNNFKKGVIAILLFALVPTATIAQIITKKVIFPTGKSATVIQGTIAGDQTIDYAVGGNQGQKLNVTLTNKSNDAFFNVLPPGSQGEAVFIGQNEGNKCSIILAKNGIYKIRVYQMRSSARRGEKASFSLSVGILVLASTVDAKVPGTNYHATGDLRAAIGSVQKSAKFGVIRSKTGAEVHATIPGKSKRVFVFSNGKWSCNSPNCKLSFAKISTDEWELICNGTEKYYIVDAVIYGG